jgi:hypothetical protein
MELLILSPIGELYYEKIIPTMVEDATGRNLLPGK